MRNLRLGVLVLASVALIDAMAGNAMAGSWTGPWTSVGLTGIDTREYVDGTKHYYCARMAYSNTNNYLETGYCSIKGIAPASVVGVPAAATVPVQADLFNGAITTYGGVWGARSQVGVAINGGPWSSSNGDILGGLVHQGWLSKRFAPDTGTEEPSGSMRFNWDRQFVLDGHKDDGELKHPVDPDRANPTLNQWIQNVTAANIKRGFSGINRPMQNPDLVIYTPQYAYKTYTGSATREVTVRMVNPVAPNQTVTGYVVATKQTGGSSLIGFDEVVLAAKGSADDTFLSYFQIGDEVQIRHTTEGGDSGSWERAYATLSGMALQPPSVNHVPNGLIVFNHQGVTTGTTGDNWSVIAKPQSGSYVLFVVTASGASPTITLNDLIAFLLSSDGVNAKFAVNLDGGSSSSFVKKNGSGFTIVTGGTRSVPTGLLMCQKVAKETSTTVWTESQVFEITATVMGRAGPGSNCAEVLLLNQYDQVEVVDHPLNGVRATTGASQLDYWWKVRRYVGSECIDCWVPEGLVMPRTTVVIDDADPGCTNYSCFYPPQPYPSFPNCFHIAGGDLYGGGAVRNEWYSNTIDRATVVRYFTNSIPITGNYRVQALVRGGYVANPNVTVQYQVHSNEPSDSYYTCDQSQQNGWIDLGVHPFTAYSSNPYEVWLRLAVPEPTTGKMLVDAVRWVKVN